MYQSSLDKFIFGHYSGHTAINDTTFYKYAVILPRWKLKTIEDYTIEYEFEGCLSLDSLV
jgi:hypothetical protein